MACFTAMIPIRGSSVLVLMTTIALVTGCPDINSCQCDLYEMSMLCEGLSGITWSQLMTMVPSYVEKMWLIASKFDGEQNNSTQYITTTPGESTVVKHSLLYLHVTRSNLLGLDRNTFLTVPNIKELHFNEVVLDTEVLSFLSVLKQIEVVDLSYNELVEIPVDLLQKWPFIRELYLGHNKIPELNFHVFDVLSPVQILDVSHNLLTFIHPESFQNGTSLNELNLQSNKLEYLHEQLISDMGPSAVLLHLSGNPWACHCGMQWLHQALTSQHMSNVSYADGSEIQCASPDQLRFMKLMDLSADQLQCEQPNIPSYPVNQSIHYMSRRVIDCNVTGYPTPSVYWLTPHGPVVHPNHRYWVPPDVALSPSSIHFTGGPSYLHAAIKAQPNGSLLFEDFRYYFNGEYTCIAVNPAGLIDHSLNVTITVGLPSVITSSLMWGFSSAGCFFLIGLAIGGILYSTKRPVKFVLEGMHGELTITYPDGYYDSCDDCSEEIYYFDTSPLHSYKCSPRYSPKKCVTPAEGMDPEHRLPDMGGNIRETLESVRTRLRMNMEKQVDRMKSQAQHVKQTSHRYMKNVKTSTGRTMKTLRHTSSQYVHKMRVGMVLGMEQVKNHVQSMKELCGTGHMSHTISTISVSTDIDSNQKKAVVKSITYV